jgi:transcriptional regulator with XRE-family HTH domain
VKNEQEIEKFYKIIGKNVKQKREAKGLSQLQLTHLMGFKSVSLVSQAEISHNQHFSLKHLFMIASILECDILDFFDGVKISKLDWE